MKSDQMGTGHNNPSPRELPLSNQARFNTDLGSRQAHAGAVALTCDVILNACRNLVSLSSGTNGMQPNVPCFRLKAWSPWLD